MIIEISRKYLNDFYKGNIMKLIKEKDYLEWDSEKIKAAFAAGNGTDRDLKRYMIDNRKFCIFMKI